MEQFGWMCIGGLFASTCIFAGLLFGLWKEWRK